MILSLERMQRYQSSGTMKPGVVSHYALVQSQERRALVAKYAIREIRPNEDDGEG